MLRALTSEEVETLIRHPFAYSNTRPTLSSPSPRLLDSIMQPQLPSHTREERLLSPLCRHWSWSRRYVVGVEVSARVNAIFSNAVPCRLGEHDAFLITMIAIRG